MPRPLPVDYLQEDEEALHESGRHPLSVLDELLGMFVLLAVLAAGTAWAVLRFLPQLWLYLGLPVVVAAGVGFVLFLVASVWRVQTSHYVVTPERTYKAYGRIRFNLLQTTYDKVTDLHVRQSVFGRLWGFGTVRLETAGTGIALEGVRDPFGYKQRIEDARSRFIHALVAEHAPSVARRRAREATASTEPDAEASPGPERGDLWSGNPTLASFLANGARALVAVFVALVFAVGGAFGESRFLLATGGLLVYAGLVLASAWIRYRYTRYHVEGRGVVVTAGWLTRRRVETTYDKVTDVTVYQGLLARMLGYGNITINTAGSNQAPVVFQGLKDPEGVKAIIDDARRRREGRA